MSLGIPHDSSVTVNKWLSNPQTTRPSVCRAAQPAGQSLCPGPGWQPRAGDRPVSALALGAAAGTGLIAGAGAAAPAGPGPIRQTGAVVLVRPPAVPCGGGALGAALAGGGGGGLR